MTLYIAHITGMQMSVKSFSIYCIIKVVMKKESLARRGVDMDIKISTSLGPSPCGKGLWPRLIKYIHVHVHAHA